MDNENTACQDGQHEFVEDWITIYECSIGKKEHCSDNGNCVTCVNGFPSSPKFGKICIRCGATSLD